MPTTVNSVSNPRIRYLRSLHDARTRRREGVYFVEGVRLVEEALNADLEPRLALIEAAQLDATERGQALAARLLGLEDQGRLELLYVNQRVMRAVSDLVTPPGVLAIVPERPWQGGDLGPFALVLDRLQDPGNAGTILRSAEAAGIVSSVVAIESVDLYSPKVVRAAMGAHFYLPLWADGATWPLLYERLKGRPILATRAKAGIPYYHVDWRRPLALVIGNEAHGLSPEAAAVATAWVTIPMAGHAESLNASVAAGILLFEAARAKRGE